VCFEKSLITTAVCAEEISYKVETSKTPSDKCQTARYENFDWPLKTLKTALFGGSDSNLSELLTRSEVREDYPQISQISQIQKHPLELFDA